MAEIYVPPRVDFSGARDKWALIVRAEPDCGKSHVIHMVNLGVPQVFPEAQRLTEVHYLEDVTADLRLPNEILVRIQGKADPPVPEYLARLERAAREGVDIIIGAARERRNSTRQAIEQIADRYRVIWFPHAGQVDPAMFEPANMYTARLMLATLRWVLSDAPTADAAILRPSWDTAA